jgi:hypothetical protein
MRLLKLLALLVVLTAAAAAVAYAADPGRNLQVILRPASGAPQGGFGLLDFRQPKNRAKIVHLDVRVWDVLPGRAYRLERATDPNVDDTCTGTNWLTLGRGLVPAAIRTTRNGNGRAKLFRDLSVVPTGTEMDIHFRVIDAATSAVVLQSFCYQFTVRQ